MMLVSVIFVAGRSNLYAPFSNGHNYAQRISVASSESSFADRSIDREINNDQILSSALNAHVDNRGNFAKISVC